MGNIIFKDSSSFLLTSFQECASKLRKDDLFFTRRYFENQAIINNIPVIDASQHIVTSPAPPQPASSTHSKPCLQESVKPSKDKSPICNPIPKRRYRNIFIDDEAEVLREEESEEDSDDEDNSINNFINDRWVMMMMRRRRWKMVNKINSGKKPIWQQFWYPMEYVECLECVTSLVTKVTQRVFGFQASV